MNNDFLKWLEMQREVNNKYFTVYEICKIMNKPPNTTTYRKFNRMVAYGLIEHKYDIERRTILYRRKK